MRLEGMFFSGKYIAMYLLILEILLEQNSAEVYIKVVNEEGPSEKAVKRQPP